MTAQLPIRETRSPNTLRWTIDRPQCANALNPEMLKWIEERAKALSGEVVILDSAHPRSFSAGFDLNHLQASIAALPEGKLREEELPDAALSSCTRAMAGAHGCLLAVVDGAAVGAAVELLAHCDYLFFTQRSLLRIPAREHGLVYHRAGLAQIQHRLGDRAAFELLTLGNTVNASELETRPRVQVFPDRSALEESMNPWLKKLQAQDAACLGAHCAALRCPPFRTPAADSGAYHAARLSAYRRARVKR